MAMPSGSLLKMASSDLPHSSTSPMAQAEAMRSSTRHRIRVLRQRSSRPAP